MNDNWAEVRRQLDQELARERQQRGAQRRQQPSLWLSPWQSLWQSLRQSLRAARFPFLVRPLDKVEQTQACDGLTQGE